MCDDDLELDGYWKNVRVDPSQRPADPTLDHAKRLDEACACYRNRKLRKEHPAGDTDRKSRWYPTQSEHQDCCSFIRRPSTRYPWSLMLHCRTVTHIANLYGVTEAELHQALKPPKADRPRRHLREPTAWAKLMENEDEMGCG